MDFWRDFYPVFQNLLATGIGGAAVWGLSRIPSVRAWLAVRPWAVAGLVASFVVAIPSGILAFQIYRLSMEMKSRQLPPDAVLAFDSKDACPQGWISVQALNGKAIVGATSVQVSSSGGTAYTYQPQDWYDPPSTTDPSKYNWSSQPSDKTVTNSIKKNRRNHAGMTSQNKEKAEGSVGNYSDYPQEGKYYDYTPIFDQWAVPLWFCKKAP